MNTRARRRPLVFACLVVLAGAGMPLVQAADATPTADNAQAAAPAATAAAPAGALPTVTVQGISYGADAVKLPSTAQVLGERAITEGQPQVNLSESLSQVPGLIANNRQDYAQDMQISLRGFGADAPFGVQGIYMTLDGIPLTMPDGQGQSQIINLPTIGGIKVIRGPFAALYGNAAGGVIEAFTRDAPDPPSFGLSTWIGPWNSHQTTLVGGGSKGDWSGIAGLTDFHTDGWRAHSNASRQQFNGRLTWSPHADDDVSLVVNALNQDALDPGGLTRAELQQNPRGVDPAMLAFNTRKTVTHRQLGLVWNHRFDADNTLSLATYGGTRAITQYLPFTGNFGTSAGGVVDLSDYFGGATAAYSHRTSLAGRPLTLAAGLNYGRENEFRHGYVNNHGVAGALRNDQYNTVDNFAQYLQANWELSPRWSVSGGLRHDAVRFNSANAADAPFQRGTTGSARYGSTDPVAGVLYHLDEHTEFYADYGHGFVTPTFYQLAYQPSGQPGLNFALQPMHLRNTELGVRSDLGALRLQAAVYAVSTDHQIIVASSTGGRTTYTNAGKTWRQGLDLSADARLPAHLSTHLAYSVISVRFDGGPNNGNTLPGVPRQQLYADLTWRPPMDSPALQGFYTTLSTLVRSKVFVNSANSDAAAGYGLLNWAIGVHQQQGAWSFDEFLRVDNLLDRNVVAAVVVADTNGRFFEPAPGRNAIICVKISRNF